MREKCIFAVPHHVSKVSPELVRGCNLGSLSKESTKKDHSGTPRPESRLLLIVLSLELHYAGAVIVNRCNTDITLRFKLLWISSSVSQQPRCQHDKTEQWPLSARLGLYSRKESFEMSFVCRKESPAEEVSAPHSYEDNNMEMHTNPQTISSRLADEWDPLPRMDCVCGSGRGGFPSCPSF